MFRIDSSPGALPYPTGYPAPGMGLLTGVPAFLAAKKMIDSRQMESLGTRMSTLGQMPSSYSEPCRYHTVPTVSAAQPWGTPPTTLTAPYRYNPGSPYLKSPYVYHQNAVGLTPFPRASYCDYPQEPKPTQSYIGLIAMAILSTSDKKLVLSDIYKYILEHYPYFRSRGPGWRNSIRHNLSLNECFIKSNRSSNGKGHFWAVHPANVDDFSKGDFRRRRAQRKVRRYMSQKRQPIESNPAKASDVKESPAEETVKEKECVTVIDVSDDNSDTQCDDINDCDLSNGYDSERLKSEIHCEAENPDDWDVEIDVLSTNTDVIEDSSKSTQKPGAFDMDTILSTNFPCRRRMLYGNNHEQNSLLLSSDRAHVMSADHQQSS